MSTNSIQTDISSTASVADARLPAFLAAMLGVVILFGVAFAPVDVVHNAAHDSRHGLSVPCH